MHQSAGSLPKGMGSQQGELLGMIWLLPDWITAAWKGLEVATRVDEQLLLALSMSQKIPDGLPGPLLLPNFFRPHPRARHSEGSGLRDGLHSLGGNWVPSKLPIADSVFSHLGKLWLGKFGCTNISRVCLLNWSKYLGLCSLGLLKSAGGSVIVSMHGRGSRGVGCPAPTVAGDCSVG